MSIRLKKRKTHKDHSITFRCTTEEYNRIMTKALLYCEGNLSEWALHAALNYRVVKKDLMEET